MSGVFDREPSIDLRRTATSGAALVAIGQICKIVSQFLTLLVLSRLLVPADFGVFAMIMPVVGILPLLQDFGLQQALVQAREASNAEVNRIFWVNVAIALLMAALLVASAPVAAILYDDARVEPLLALWAIPVVLTSLATHHMGLLNRQLRFADIARIEIATALATALAAVAGAFIFQNYWAMLLSAAGGAGTTLALARLATGWRPSSPLAPARVGHLIRFGAELTGADILNYLSRNVGNVVMATSFGAARLGLYDLSYKLVLLPISHVNAPVGRVVQPLLGRLRDEPARYRKAYLLVASALVWAIAPAVCALAAATGAFVDALLGDHWAPAVPVLFWLSLAGLFSLLTSTVGWLFISQHRTRERLGWSAFSAATTIAALFASLPLGIEGVAAGYALIVVVLQMPLLLHLAGRRGPVGTRDLWSVQLPVLTGGLLTFGVMYAIEGNLPTASFAHAATVIALSYAAFAIALLLLPASRERVLKLARHAIATLADLRGGGRRRETWRRPR